MPLEKETPQRRFENELEEALQEGLHKGYDSRMSLVAQQQETDLVREEFDSSEEGAVANRRTKFVAVLAAVGLVVCAVAAHAQRLGATTGQRVGEAQLAHNVMDKQAAPTQCPGTTNVQGVGEAHLVNNLVDKDGAVSGDVEVWGGTIAPHIMGRTYLADWCTEGVYDHNAYWSISLLQKTVQFTVDLGGAGCGCNVAFYFTSMKQNSDPTPCKDYYCDACNVCGARCSEVDIMEANSLVWRSTLHMAQDNVGGAAGYGGTGPHTQTWTKNEYGPGGSCIDTTKPFEVQAHFPTHEVDGEVVFQGMMVDLTQAGAPCGLTATVGWYHFGGEDAIPLMTQKLKDGMVPIISYWKSDGLSWLDGKDINGETPCSADLPDKCPSQGPKISNIMISNFTGYLHKSTMNLSPTPAPVAPTLDTLGGGFDTPMSAVPMGGAATWLQATTPDGKIYYYNPATMETSWSAPAKRK